MLSPSSHEQRRGSRSSNNFYIGNQAKKGTDYSNALYKTELCRSFNEMGCCRYGLKCRFAHGGEDLRPVTRHKKYKTEPCKNYSRDGHCPYGSRCRFVHEEDVSDMMARSSLSLSSPINSPSPPSQTENLFDFGRFGVGGDFSDSKQISKENNSLSEHFSLDADPTSLHSPWNIYGSKLSSVCSDMEKLEKEENEKDAQKLLHGFYRSKSKSGDDPLTNGWSTSSSSKDGWSNGLEKTTSSSQQPTIPPMTPDRDVLLLGTSNSTRVFGNGKILPSHFHHYEDSSWQALQQQPTRRQSFSSLSSAGAPTESTVPPVNSIASTNVSSISPVSRSSVFQPAPRKSVIGFATPGSVDTTSSFTPTPSSNSNGRSKRSVILEALEPEGSDHAPTTMDKGDLPLPQLPAFFGSLTPPNTSPTKPDPHLTFEEETTERRHSNSSSSSSNGSSTKKSVLVSSLSLSLSLVRTTSISTTTIPSSSPPTAATPTATPTATPSPPSSTPAPTSAPTATSIPSSITHSSSSLRALLPTIRLPSLPNKRDRNSFDLAELDDEAAHDIQIFSLPRRRTQSMSMSLSNSTSLFSADTFQPPISKPKTIPKVEPLATALNHPGSPPTDDPELTLPNKRLPFFATLAISPRPDIPTS